MKPDEAKSTALEGVFLPTSWRAGGEVVDISLMTFDEKDYSIDSTVARDHGLLELIRRRVRLSAVVRNGRVIEVTHIEIIKIVDCRARQGTGTCGFCRGSGTGEKTR